MNLHQLTQDWKRKEYLHETSGRLIRNLWDAWDRYYNSGNSEQLDRIERIIERVAQRNRRRYNAVREARATMREYESNLRNQYVEDWTI